MSSVSSGILCNAFAINPGSDPPTVAMQLTMVAKVKHKAAN